MKYKYLVQGNKPFLVRPRSRIICKRWTSLCRGCSQHEYIR